MTLTTRPLCFCVALVAAVTISPAPAPAAAQTTAYVFSPNSTSNNVTVVDTRTRTAVGPAIAVDASPRGVAVLPDGSKAYVCHLNSATVIPIDLATRTAGTPIPIGTTALSLTALPTGQTDY